MKRKIFLFLFVMIPVTLFAAEVVTEGNEIVKNFNYLWTYTRPLGWAILAAAFTWSLIQETSKIQGATSEGTTGYIPQYGKVIWALLLTAIVMGATKTFFPAIVNTCNKIGLSVTGVIDWKNFESMIGKRKEELGILSIFKLTFLNIWVNLFALTALSMENILLGVRSALLSILYVLAPITIACAASSETRGIFKGWLLGVVQISFWVVILKIVQAVAMTYFNASATAIGEGSEVSIVSTSIGYIVMVILIPLLTGKILSGEHLGSVGSIAIGSIAAAGSFLTSVPVISGAVATARGVVAAAPHAIKGGMSAISGKGGAGLKAAVDTYRKTRDNQLHGRRR